jgi:hypothetical protein
MTRRRALAVVAAALLAVTPVHAGAQQTAPPTAESPKAPAHGAQAPGGVSFKRDVKQAWSEASDGARKTGRAIGDGARAFGRATRDAAVNGWRKVKEAFSG